MRIVDLINKNSVKLDLNTKSKLDVVDELVDLVNDSGNLNDKNEYKINYVISSIDEIDSVLEKG